MKKSNPPSITNAAGRKLARLLWNQDVQHLRRNLEFYRNIEEQFLTNNNSYRDRVSNLFASRTER